MTTRAVLWMLAAVGLAMGALGALRERRRAKRKNLDDIGWVPWTVIQVIGLTVAAGSVAYALKIHD